MVVLKLFLKMMAWFVWIIVGLTALLVLAFTVSVKPGVYIIQKMFDAPVIILDEERYAVDAPKVELLADIEYKSHYAENTLDNFYPKDVNGAVPILFWMHGGGYVGGNKEGVSEFATYIAAANEVAVVALNYEKAPSLQYPGQVKQLEEAYQYLESNQASYPMLDFSRVMFGGDSAGAQIAGQYVAIQTNAAYAEEMGIAQVVAHDAMKAFISYSGPVDIEQMATLESSSSFMKFFTNTVARAFIGKRDWQDSEEIKQASVAKYVTEDFPPTYITDGNSFSFPDQGLALVERLEELGVPVVSLFYQDTDKEITHEYQFNYEMEEARESLRQTIDFIHEQLDGD